MTVVASSASGSGKQKGQALDPKFFIVAGLAAVALAVTGLMLVSSSSRGPSEQAADRDAGSPAGNQPVETAVADLPSAPAPQRPPDAAPTYAGSSPARPPVRPRGIPSTTAAAAGFAALVERVEAAAHQPRTSLNAASSLMQEAMLCEVGDVAISVAFPSEPLPDPEAATIACLPEGPRRWRLELTAADGRRCDVGGLAIRDGQLVASLPLASPDNHTGRAAVAAAVIRIADEADPGRFTHVQLRRSAVQQPLVFQRLAFDPRWAAAIGRPGDDAANPATAPRLSLMAPPTPWPCRATLTGKCGQAEAVVTVQEEGAPFAGPSGTPTRLLAAWALPGAAPEPFLETGFVIEPVSSRTRAGLRLTHATLPALWGSPRRFGSLREPDREPAQVLPGGVPPAGLLPPMARLMADCGWLLADDGSPVSNDQMASFARVLVRVHRAENPAVGIALLVFQSPRFAGRSQPLARWLAELREELEQSRGEAAIALRMLLDELAAMAADKRLAAEVLTALGPGTAVIEGRVESYFPSLDAAAVNLRIGAADGSGPLP